MNMQIKCICCNKCRASVFIGKALVRVCKKCLKQSLDMRGNNMPAMKPRDFQNHLTSQGCIFIRQTANHQVWSKGQKTAVITGDRKDVSPGVIRSVCRLLEIPKP